MRGPAGEIGDSDSRQSIRQRSGPAVLQATGQKGGKKKYPFDSKGGGQTHEEMVQFVFQSANLLCES
jgi:hypothetical protein